MTGTGREMAVSPRRTCSPGCRRVLVPAAPAVEELPAWERPAPAIFQSRPMTFPDDRGKTRPVAAPVGSEDQWFASPAAQADRRAHGGQRPHFAARHQVMEADLTAVVAHRAAWRQFAAKDVNLTFTPYFIQAVIEALKAVPQVNAVHRDRWVVAQTSLQHRHGDSRRMPDGRSSTTPTTSACWGWRKVNDLAACARSNKLTLTRSRATFCHQPRDRWQPVRHADHQPNVGILGVG